MFVQSPTQNPDSFADVKNSARKPPLGNILRLQLAEYGRHFLAEPFAVESRVKPQQAAINADAEHRSGLLPCDPQIRQVGELLHPAYFELQILTSP